LIADRANRRVRKVDARGFIKTTAGEGKPTGIIIDPEIGARGPRFKEDWSGFYSGFQMEVQVGMAADP